MVGVYFEIEVGAFEGSKSVGAVVIQLTPFERIQTFYGLKKFVGYRFNFLVSYTSNESLSGVGIVVRDEVVLFETR